MIKLLDLLTEITIDTRPLVRNINQIKVGKKYQLFKNNWQGGVHQSSEIIRVGNFRYGQIYYTILSGFEKDRNDVMNIHNMKSYIDDEKVFFSK